MRRIVLILAAIAVNVLTLQGQRQWQPLPTLTGSGEAHSLVQDRSEKLFLLSQNLIYSSDDNGDSWRMIPRPDNPLMLYKIAIDSTGALLAGGHGSPGEALFRSTDAGATWSTLTSYRGSSAASVTVAADGSYYAADPLLYRSTNLGATWDTMPVGASINYQLAALPNGRVIQKNRLLDPVVSPDASNWLTIVWPGLGAGSLNALSIATIDSTRACAIVRTNPSSLYLCRSVNGGSTWVKATNPPPGLSSLALYVDRLGGVIVQGSDGEFYRSTDLGATWEWHGSGPGEMIGHFCRVGGDTIMAGGFDGPYRSIDGGMTWMKAAEGITRTTRRDFAPTIDGMAMTTVEHGVQIYSVASDTWRKIAPASNDINAVEWLDDGRLLGGSRYTLYVSDVEVTRLDAMKSTIEFFPEPFVALGSGDRMLFVVSEEKGAVKISNDTGNSWTPLSPPPQSGETSMFTSLYRGLDNTVYTHSSHRLFRVDDLRADDPSAARLTQIYANDTLGVSVAFAGDNGTILCASLGQVHSSTDHGATWRELPSFDDTTYVYSIAVSGDNEIYVATQRLDDQARWYHDVHVFDEELNTWVSAGYPESGYYPSTVIWLFVDRSGRVFIDHRVVGFFMARTISGIRSPAADPSTLDATIEWAEQGGSPTLQLRLTAPDRVRISLYTVTGKEIFVNDREMDRGGEHSVQIDLDGVAHGIYLLKVDTEIGGSCTIPIVRR